MSSRTRRLLPLMVAAIALAIVIRQVKFDELRSALAHAPIGQLLLFSGVMTLVNCAADTFAMYHVFRGFGLRLRYFDLYTIRAATYLLAVLNYHAGQLGIIGFIHRVGKVPLSRASGWILFIIGIWVGLLFLLASLGAFLGGDKGRMLTPVLVAFLLGVAVYLPVLIIKPRFLREPPRLESLGARAGLVFKGWALLQSVLSPLLEAGVVGHLRAVLVRLPHLAILVFWHFVALRAFGIEIPVLQALIYLPVVFAVASLPITPQGLGTSQLAALYFFKDFVPVPAQAKEAVLAYSLSMAAISTISNLSMGFLFLKRGTRLGLSVSPAAGDTLEADSTVPTSP